MGIFDGLLILSDMDGTLTHNERLSDENAEAIKYFCRNGGYFSVATGRQPHYIKSFEPKMTPNAPVVALNGTVVFDTKSNKCLYKNPLKDKAGSVIRYAAKNYQKIDTICANMLSDTFEWHKNAPGQPDFDFKNNEIMKILFISFNKDFLIQLKDELTEKFPDFIFLRSWENGLEMLPEGTGKGECIEILKKCLPVKKVIGAGDYENDISLIRMSDIGCAAKNSAPLLLNHADYISVDCREHIIADIVKRLENNDILI